MMKRLSLALVAACGVAAVLCAAPVQPLAGLSLSFEENRGQVNSAVKFLTRTPGGAAFILQDGVLLSMGGEQRTAIRLRVLDANTASSVTGEAKLPGTVNYLRRDPAESRTNIATFAKVRAREVLPGIDAVYYGRDRQLEYDFVVRPGAKVDALHIAADGVDQLSLDTSGDLLLHTPHGVLKQHAPIAYQVVNGERKAVNARYALPSNGTGPIRFDVGEYDHTRELVIDPVISFGTFLGGSSHDEANAVAVDAAGNAYIAGTTWSTDLPTIWFPLQRSSYQLALDGNSDVFITKVNSNGTAILYTTYLGGTNMDEARAIAVDAQGYVSVAGATYSKDFPVTTGAWRTVLYPCMGGFLTRLDPTGHSLAYSTYLVTASPINDTLCALTPNLLLGGWALDDGTIPLRRMGIGGIAANCVAIDSQGNTFVAGDTRRLLFDPMLPLQESSNTNNTGGFVCKFNPSGAIQYATFLGGSSNVVINGIAVDATGAAYIAGGTDSPNLPVTAGAAQPTFQKPSDAFVAKVDPSGYSLNYCTYLGGAVTCDPFLINSNAYSYLYFRGYDVANAIAVATNGVAWVAGTTKSPDFPLAGAPVQTALRGIYGVPSFVGDIPSVSADAFVTAVAPDGKSFRYSSLLGGTNSEDAFAIAVAGDGSVVVGGRTTSRDFPTYQAWQSTLRGPSDGFIARIHPTDGFVYSSYLGGTVDDEVNSVAVDVNGAVFAAGRTASANFPTTSGSANPSFLGGSNDAFLVKIGTSFSLASLSPSNAVVGTPYVLLSINGTNLPSDTRVLFGSLERPILSITSNQVVVIIYASNLLQAATVPVTIVRSNGTAADNVLPFTIMPVPGDNFVAPLSLAGFSNSVTVTNTYATHQTGEPLHAFTSGAHSIWWSWTAPATGTVEFNTTGSDFDTTLAIYTGNQIDALTPVAWNDDEAAPTIRTSKAQFNAVAGTTYRIAGDGWSSASGKLVLNMFMAFPAPTLTGIDQATALAGMTGFPINIYGSNFVSASRVLVNSAPRAATLISSTQLLSTIYTSDLGTPGNVFVSVWTPEPGGGTTASATIQVLPAPSAPVLTSLKPNTALVGNETMVVVANGSNFVTNSVVKWNGSPRATTFFSSKQLLFSVPATDLLAISTNSVTVFTPAPGGGASGARQFYVTGTNGGAQTLSLKALGYTTDGFKYEVNGEIGTELIIQSTTNFTQWTSLDTNVLLNTPVQLLDADTNTPAKYLRGIATE